MDLLQRALCREASDIHIEPCSPAGYRLRLRVDGLMTPAQGCPAALAEGLVARLKVLARLDIAERRQPQDGQFSAGGDGPPCSLRLSTLPTLYREKAVLRLLRCSPERLTLKRLGMPATLRRRVIHVLRQPRGLMLITGPTGSGKTLTLYAMLNMLRRRPLNICSVEDPVELPLTGINQCQVNFRARLDFPLRLWALLRQDPDVLMVGEIRDNETAAVALNAALTGHLVLSTQHTLCADDAVSRLRQLGLDATQAGPALAWCWRSAWCDGCAPTAGARHVLRLPSRARQAAGRRKVASAAGVAISATVTCSRCWRMTPAVARDCGAPAWRWRSRAQPHWQSSGASWGIRRERLLALALAGFVRRRSTLSG